MTPFRFIAATGVLLALSVPCSAVTRAAPTHKVGLGKVLTSEGQGQIFGFDINREGNDGVLATASSVQIFDQDKGKILKAIGHSKTSDSDYVVYGIAAGDVGLVDHEVVPEGEIFPKRHYLVMNPVSGQKFTGKWTPTQHQIIAQQMSEDQSSAITSVFALAGLKQDEVPLLLVSDVAANTFSQVFHLDPDLFGLNTGPNLAQYTAANQAVFALSPDGGAVGGVAPINVLIDLSNGKQTQFNGYNNGFFHAGAVNGLAVDPNAGIAATTTELNAQVEFYDLKKMSGITFAQLPCTGATDQLNSGTTIANDPLNKLFLVVEPNYCDGSQGSALLVYNERGKLVNTIAGFTLPKDAVINPPPRINPSKRMGWLYGGPDGDGRNQLTQFFY
ncbi:MAG: hypothetical protein JO056_09485 [Alphaproteobacteria bacterium]|nr:hypothetical protein [Alphaproteobacteria bacterium]